MLLQPGARIGKNGLTPAVLHEIDALLDRKKLLKVKMLKASFGLKEKQIIIDEVVSHTGALLVQSVGMVFTLYRERPRHQHQK